MEKEEKKSLKKILTVQVEESVIKLADHLVKDIGSAYVTRSSVVRRALLMGLASIEREACECQRADQPTAAPEPEPEPPVAPEPEPPSGQPEAPTRKAKGRRKSGENPWESPRQSKVPEDQTLDSPTRKDGTTYKQEALNLGLPEEAITGVWFQFTNHEFDKKKTDWAAAWRNWVARHIEWNGGTALTSVDRDVKKDSDIVDPSLAEAIERSATSTRSAEGKAAWDKQVSTWKAEVPMHLWETFVQHGAYVGETESELFVRVPSPAFIGFFVSRYPGLELNKKPVTFIT